MLLTFANGIQPMSSGFFTSIGKAGLGIIMSLTQTGDLPASIDHIISLCLWELMALCMQDRLRRSCICTGGCFCRRELGKMKKA